MTSNEEDEAIIRILAVDGRYGVLLTDERVLDVRNIAWGQDFDEAGYHVTTNVSPSYPGLPIDLFSTREVVNITAENQIIFSARQNLI